MTDYGFTFDEINVTEPMTEQMWQWARSFALKTPLASKDTYWGQEMLMAKMGDGSVIKRIDMHAGKQSSMEYHLTKDETYYLLQGELEIGVRVGRAENRSIQLLGGELFHVPPGLCHMRKAISDLVIVEFASTDDPKDTHIVEDGKTYEHICKEPT